MAHAVVISNWQALHYPKFCPCVAETARQFAAFAKCSGHGARSWLLSARSSMSMKGALIDGHNSAFALTRGRLKPEVLNHKASLRRARSTI
jgi:hypothetical protein